MLPDPEGLWIILPYTHLAVYVRVYEKKCTEMKPDYCACCRK